MYYYASHLLACDVFWNICPYESRFFPDPIILFLRSMSNFAPCSLSWSIWLQPSSQLPQLGPYNPAVSLLNWRRGNASLKSRICWSLWNNSESLSHTQRIGCSYFLRDLLAPGSWLSQTNEKQVNLDCTFYICNVKYLMMEMSESLIQDNPSQEENTWIRRFLFRLFIYQTQTQNVLKVIFPQGQRAPLNRNPWLHLTGRLRWPLLNQSLWLVIAMNWFP